MRVLLSYQNVLTAWQVLILNCFLFIREEEEDDDNDHGLNDDNDSDEELDEEAEEQRILQPGQFNANLNLPEEEEPEDIPDEEEDGEDDTPVVNTPPRPAPNPGQARRHLFENSDEWVEGMPLWY